MNDLSQTFDPAQIDPTAFRRALGTFATGVAVITCQSPSGPMGITANSFASVSLDPPLVLWSPAKASRRYQAYAQAASFAIHILNEDQKEISARFVKDGHAFDAPLDWEASDANVPLIKGCLARFECETHAIHDGGDHSIIVGRVTRVAMSEGRPLVFSQGTYGGFVKAS